MMEVVIEVVLWVQVEVEGMAYLSNRAMSDMYAYVKDIQTHTNRS